MRSVLVTGGARGIGRAIAERFARDGYTVIAPTRAEADLSHSAAVDQLVASLAARRVDVDVLINNAGENPIRRIAEVDDATFEHVLALNLATPFRLTRAFAPGMAARGWGRIVNVASIYGLVSREGRALYTATKSALIGLTKTTAIEYGPSGVLCNALCPGFIDTDLTRQNNSPEQIAALCARVPLRRLGSVEEIAEMAFLLGSGQNTYLTGQAVVIDGGLLAG
jgi:3-oxoacyl-[acyl-carrier protein] reductase